MAAKKCFNWKQHVPPCPARAVLDTVYIPGIVTVHSPQFTKIVRFIVHIAETRIIAIIWLLNFVM